MRGGGDNWEVMNLKQTYNCALGIGDHVTGEALVACDNFSARYDLDRERGVFSRRSHELYGKSYVGKILVLNTAKGGVATSWMLLDMVTRGMAPAALVFNRTNPIMAQGAAFANLPLVHHFDGDITMCIDTGDHLALYPQEGLLIKEFSIQS